MRAMAAFADKGITIAFSLRKAMLAEGSASSVIISHVFHSLKKAKVASPGLMEPNTSIYPPRPLYFQASIGALWGTLAETLAFSGWNSMCSSSRLRKAGLFSTCVLVLRDLKSRERLSEAVLVPWVHGFS